MADEVLDGTDAQRERLNTGTKPVAESHRFDEAVLDRWLRANVAGFAGPLEVRQFKGGQSNPTYQLVTPGKTYVMRRKPPGKLLPSAHAVDREYRVISALHPTGFPVARPYGLCLDEGVIGTMFYVMDMVEGRILWDQSLPTYSPGERREIFFAKLQTLAALHNADYQALGLGDFGRPGNYMARQVDRWSKQYRASETQPIVEMEKLIAWLPGTVPEQERTSIVHGDYRLDNMVLHPTEPRVIAVLDWELATLGEPLADFTYLLMNWHEGALTRVADLKAHGVPTVEEYVAEYMRLTGRTRAPDLHWFLAYNGFRLAAILQGVIGRARDGTANSPQAAEMLPRVLRLAAAAWDFAQRAGAKG
ncbi:phosphotransferase [Phenylobacterium sp.]|jgi:aminoglycoside phosphotransferase (APT) family kinase protein|uniref:phosphotransferase n=1 Tax=Phenylobacterium sp. TaxID=1871053 RepID=UPI002F3F5B42